jgi:ABC-type lipoprotein release transport system permease subunit
MSMVSPGVGRLLNLLDYSGGSLARKWGKNFAVGAIFSLVVFLFASFQLMRSGLAELSGTLLASAPDITVQQLVAGRQTSIQLACVDQLADIYGIRRIDTRIWGYYFDAGNGANYTVLGLDRAVLKRLSEQEIHFLDGRTSLPPGAGEVVISERVGSLLQLGERRRFSLFQPDLQMQSFTVAGRFRPEAEAVAGDLILMDLADARQLFALSPSEVTDLMIEVANPLEATTVARKIADRLPGVRVITREQIAQTYSGIFGYRSGLATLCLLTALVCFIILAWDKASGLSVEELREVAILKILGWQTGDILLLRFFETLVVAVFAFALGYLGAWLHIGFWGGGLLRPILLGWSVLRPELQVVPPFLLSDLLLLLALTVVPYLCATAIPAWRSAVIRSEGVL